MAFEFIGNRVFDDRFSAFLKQEAQSIDRKPLDTGAKVLPNGDVAFGFYAPNAASVNVVFGIKAGEPFPLTKGEDGVFRGTLAYDPLFKGPKAFEFEVDGARCISAYCSQYYSHNMAINYVEIPDPDADFLLLRDVPHGSVTTELYYSRAAEDYTRCLVYTPPMYHEGGEYPVLYLQHGYGENETSWVYGGKAAHIMDNLIADGKITPFLIVMNDGMLRGKTPFEDVFGKTLIEDCIPLIESRYRVKKGAEHRAIAGFSMGSMQACMLGLSRTDVFGNVGLFSGFMRGFGPAQGSVFDANPHLRILQDEKAFTEQVRVFFRAIGSIDFAVGTFREDSQMLAEHGFDRYPNLISRIYEGYPHDWAVMRRMLHDFALLLFR